MDEELPSVTVLLVGHILSSIISIVYFIIMGWVLFGLLLLQSAGFPTVSNYTKMLDKLDRDVNEKDEECAALIKELDEWAVEVWEWQMRGSR